MVGFNYGTDAFSEYADVVAYGAVGDGVTDDTSAIQAAFTASKNVYFPTGVYVCSNLTTQPLQRIRGSGASSIILFKTGSTGYLIESGANSIQICDIVLDGGSNTDKSATGSAGTRSGLHLSALSPNVVVKNVSICGFTNIGIGLNGIAELTYEGPPVITGCNFNYNYIGVDTGVGCDDGTATTGAEYLKFSDCTFHKNRIGCKNNSGNNTFTGCHFVANGYGFYLNGVARNGAHGSIVGCTINHNTISGFYATAVTSGFTFTGNQIFASNIDLLTCTGLSIVCNTFSGVVITLTNGFANLIAFNWFGTGATVNRTTDNCIMFNNYKTNGTYDQSLQFLSSGGAILGANTFTAPQVISDSNHSEYRLLSLYNSDTGGGGQGAVFKLGGYQPNDGGGVLFIAKTNLGSNVSSSLIIRTTNVGGGTFDALFLDIDGTAFLCGNLKLNVAGKGLYLKEGSNCCMGVATLVGGTVTVSTTKVTANSRIFLTVQSLGTVAVATPVAVTARSAGTSFTITSSAPSDTSIVAWQIVEPS